MLSKLLNYLSEAKKTVITALGLVISIGTVVLNNFSGFLPTNVATAVSAAVALATVVLAYFAPNETAKAERAVGRSMRVKGQKPRKVAA